MGCTGNAGPERQHALLGPHATKTWFALAICVFLMRPSLRAQEPTPEDLRKLARNPFADVIKLPISPDIYFNAGPNHRTAADLQLMPLIPIHRSPGWILIPRIVTTAITYVPDLTRESGGSLGLGDTVATFFLTPAHVKRFIWAVGPALLIPTATGRVLGVGRWGLGPSAAVFYQSESVSGYILVQNIWSFPASTDRGPVRQMQLQPQFSYNLPQQWYLTTNPTISADWTQVTSYRWLVPIGVGVGRTFKVGRQPVDVNLAIYNNVVRPANQVSPRWQLTLQATLLFTRHRKPTR
jgi:hypothetical protein